jgi:Arc/MetJ family transcription regulator
MATNLALDDKLIDQAVRLGKHKSKKEAVTAALESYVRQRKRAGLSDLIGNVDFHDDFDHRAMRRRRAR